MLQSVSRNGQSAIDSTVSQQLTIVSVWHDSRCACPDEVKPGLVVKHGLMITFQGGMDIAAWISSIQICTGSKHYWPISLA